METSTATLLRLTETAVAIGHELPFSAVQFLLWLYLAQPYPTVSAFTAFCVLVLAAHLSRAGDERFRDVNALELCEWSVGVERECRTAIGPWASSESWLIGLSSYEDSKGNRERWKRLADSVLGASSPTDAVQTAFAEVARRLNKQ